MTKRITDNQILGELGETSVKKIVLETGFIYEHRGRLEAGTDGLIELRDPRSGAPLGKLLGVQVKATGEGKYVRETEKQFEYLLKPNDLAYWRQSNIPVIIVVWRQSDDSAYWKDVTDSVKGEERRLKFDKQADVFDKSCADRLGDLTIDRRTPGVFVPPLNQGEAAIINLLRVRLPDEIFVATSPFGGGRDAVPELLKQSDTRFDWVIRKRRYVSFFDPRNYGTKAIVDLDQVEAIETKLFALNDELDDTNDTIDAAKIPRKVKRESNRQTQAKATRAWNLLNALFYKAGKVPWRLLPDQAEYRTSFLGIGFYRDLNGQQLWTSTAQMFDERGRGLILRGARAQTETKGRHPYLTAADADDLVTQSIAAYKTHHKHVPARVVVLKTSRFRPEEAEGIDAALERLGIDLCDLLWVQESSPIAVFRDGNYPVLRGTFVDLKGKGLLYTRGSVPYYGTYPGLRVPRPLLLVPHENSDSALPKLAEEVLALTKVNWNTTQFDQKLPAPIKAAREVGRILKHIEYGVPTSPDFRKYT